MISIEDCIAFCGLTEEEVLALAEHEHIPEIAAAALGRYLLDQKDGCQAIRRMIVDDIRGAMSRGDEPHAAELMSALRHFLAEHPEAGSGRAA